ncbi:MAG: N-terminal domain of NEFA-interacting nuclear protein NIP30-domain-containing protein [Benniella sp.]|nr:MAG: N-terminal domain of NEFA-interacting nuclear protein NIP30-domain-containing protein [Benniella sp.]
MSSINFVSADAIEEARKTRQEEWERAHANAENPPPLKEEEPYDPRTLYERLQEQKQKKQDAFLEATKFGNLIHKIDNDEFEFLNTLEDDEAKKKQELADQEAEELKKFRMNVKLRSAPPPPVPLLSGPGSIVPKSSANASSTLTGGSTTSTPKKKASLFAGLVKRDNSSSASSTSAASTPSSTSKPATSSSSQLVSTATAPVDGSKATGKRKADEPLVHVSGNDEESKKPKVDGPSATTSKPNALLNLIAYDSSSDEDE